MRSVTNHKINGIYLILVHRTCTSVRSVETRLVGGYLLTQMQHVDLEYVAPEQTGRTVAYVDTRAGIIRHIFVLVGGKIAFGREFNRFH